jgi:hypothetical protein
MPIDLMNFPMGTPPSSPPPGLPPFSPYPPFKVWELRCVDAGDTHVYNMGSIPEINFARKSVKIDLGQNRFKNFANFFQKLNPYDLTPSISVIHGRYQHLHQYFEVSIPYLSEFIYLRYDCGG